MDRVFGKKDVDAKYIPLDIIINAIQYLDTLVPAHRLKPLFNIVDKRMIDDELIIG